MSDPRAHIAIYLYAPSGGGATRRTFTLAEGFAARGNRVSLVVVNPDGPLAKCVPAGVEWVVLDSRLTRLVARSGARSRRRVSASVFALASFLRRSRPDVLLSAGNHAHKAAVIAVAWSRTRVRLVLRVSTHLTRSHTGEHGRARPSRIGWTRWLYGRADAVVAVSQGIADDLAATTRLTLDAISTISNPTWSPAIAAAAEAPLAHPWLVPGAPPLLLSAGRLAPSKDFATLLRAFARVRSARPARLVILGEGRRRPGLEALGRELGVAQDLALPGYVDNPFQWMARAAVFVLSSAWEGSPGVLVEAMACGCPVVSTDCASGPAEILAGGRYGRLVPVGDDEALAQAILASLDAPVDGTALRARASEFDVARAVDRYLKILLGRR